MRFYGPYRTYALQIIAGLYQLPRTCWIDRGILNAETVGEHSDALVAMAKLFSEITDLDKMLKIHDWVEYDKSVGDLRTDTYFPTDHRRTKEEKAILELKAIKKICQKLGPYGKTIFNLWTEYEEGKTERAKIAFQLDKLQAILKAIEYEKNGEPACSQEFIDYSGKFIVHPKLKEILAEAIIQKECK